MHDHGDLAFREFYNNASAPRIFTDAPITQAIRRQHPDLELHVIPVYASNLLLYAEAGHASAEPMAADAALEGQQPLSYRMFLPNPKRVGGDPGVFVDVCILGKWLYTWQGREYVVYIVNGRDGTSNYAQLNNQFVVSRHSVDGLIKVVAEWQAELRDAILVFDQGYWQKNRELYKTVRKASWDDVILDADMKRELRNDVLRFFKSRERYAKLRVPWRRGEIYYGPPGNGKTVSLKALMNELYSLKEPIPTLYVRSLAGYGGPESMLKNIFQKARLMAPCLLIFEDLDSVITDGVRSYFLNEVDGLQTNDGVLIIGSTNHIDRLDPGISKRPSRFDRKYLFPKPVLDQRTQYCEFWRAKLADNKDIEFPQRLCPAIAGITDDFSFAYMQEAFVASLLTLAHEDDDEDEQTRGVGEDMVVLSTRDNGSGKPRDDDLEKLVLWRTIREQVKILREEM